MGRKADLILWQIEKNNGQEEECNEDDINDSADLSWVDEMYEDNQ